MEDGIEPFLPISTLHNRVNKWEELTGKIGAIRGSSKS